jgi:hypothetical protein
VPRCGEQQQRRPSLAGRLDLQTDATLGHGYGLGRELDGNYWEHGDNGLGWK